MPKPVLLRQLLIFDLLLVWPVWLDSRRSRSLSLSPLGQGVFLLCVCSFLSLPTGDIKNRHSNRRFSNLHIHICSVIFALLPPFRTSKSSLWSGRNSNSIKPHLCVWQKRRCLSIARERRRDGTGGFPVTILPLLPPMLSRTGGGRVDCHLPCNGVGSNLNN